MSVLNCRSDVLDIAYLSGGAPDGTPVLLLHGWPDDPTAWTGVIAALELAGYRWFAPWLRGFGQTRFLDGKTLRDGSSAALAQDALDLADALGLRRFAAVGHDWGARAAYALAAIAPERLTTISALGIGYSPGGRYVVPSYDQCRRWWYQWLMCTDAGAARVREEPLRFAHLQWEHWSPAGWFIENTFDAAAESFRNPDWVDITLHGYRHRWSSVPLDDRYARQRDLIDGTETLTVPTLMIQGEQDFCDPPAQSEGLDRYFSGGYRRVVIGGVGHFPAREAPQAVAEMLIQHLGKPDR